MVTETATGAATYSTLYLCNKMGMPPWAGMAFSAAVGGAVGTKMGNWLEAGIAQSNTAKKLPTERMGDNVEDILPPTEMPKTNTLPLENGELKLSKNKKVVCKTEPENKRKLF